MLGAKDSVDEMAMIILRKHMVERRAKEWLKDKINQ
jgi:hypothetical protein